MKRLKFREIVKQNHLSYKELMEILNKSKPTIQTYMSGRTDPDLDSYIKISEYLGKTLDELIFLNQNSKALTKEEKEKLKEAKNIIEKLI